MHIILLTVGTDGDIFPFVSLGAELRSRGHRITLASSDDFHSLALEHGFGFAPLLSAAEMRGLLANPDFWHPLKTVPISAKWGARFIERQYHLICDLARGDDSVLVSSPAIFGSALVHETMRRPLVTLVLQPWMIPSCIAPPAMPMITFPPWTPKLVLQGFWRFIGGVGDYFIGPELNRLRSSLKLRPARRILQNWFSAQLVIGMFPEWYGPPQSDWPRQIKLAGFPMFDGKAQTKLAPELLNFCQRSRTVAFTFGTGMMHSAKLFREAIKACGILDIQGIVLTKYRDQLPDALPPMIRHVTFAPFQQLFPHCAAIVHHGGIGTVAKALAAGVPQLALPLAFDQMDNAARIGYLGVGATLRAAKVTGENIAFELRRLNSAEARARCRDISERFRQNDSPARAASWIEQLDLG